MPKAKPVSLHPLTFDEAIKTLIHVNIDKMPKQDAKKGTRKKNQKT
jgi:hypothetical protein